MNVLSTNGQNQAIVTVPQKVWAKVNGETAPDGRIARLDEENKVVVIKTMAAGQRALEAIEKVGDRDEALCLAAVVAAQPGAHPLNADTKVYAVWSHHVAAATGVAAEDRQSFSRALKASRA